MRMVSPKVWIVLGVLLVVLVVGALVMWLLADRLFFFPDDRIRGTPEDYGVEAEVVRFSAPDGPELHGWWLRPEGEHRGTVVYCHGNAGNVTLHARHVAWLPAKGFAVLVFDYRGYGKSEGEVTRAGAVDDAVAAIDFALARDPERTVVFGHSLGGAIGVTATARRDAVRAVVAESTFANYREIACSMAPPFCSFVGLFVSKGQDPDAVLDQLPPRPIFVIHGDEDQTVSVDLGRALYERASEPKQLWIVPGGKHLSPWHLVPDEFERRVVEFFTTAIDA